MPTMRITLSKEQKAFVQKMARACGARSGAEYVVYLIQDEQLRSQRDRIDALLLEGLRGPFTEMTRGDWKEIEREAMARLAKEKRTRLKKLSGKVRMEDNWKKLEAAEMKSKR